MLITRLAKAASTLVPTKLLALSCAPVLTYHACYDDLPPCISPVDNVSALRVYEQLAILKKHLTFVTIDEFCDSGARPGLAAVTFDDGYKSVFENCLPIFEAHGIPFTVYTNTLGPERRTFWRYKVMYVVQNSLTSECEATFKRVVKLPGQVLHSYSKDPRNNSSVVEREIDAFLESRGYTLPKCDYLIGGESGLLQHKLVSYGNHTAHHYVLSSLGALEQHQEIDAAKRYLESMSGISVSRTFAAPFGESHHVNRDTFSVLKDLGYKYLLVNRGGVNRGVGNHYGITVVERFSVMDNPIAWQLKRQYFDVMIGQPSWGVRDDENTGVS